MGVRIGIRLLACGWGGKFVSFGSLDGGGGTD